MDHLELWSVSIFFVNERVSLAGRFRVFLCVCAYCHSCVCVCVICVLGIYILITRHATHLLGISIRCTFVYAD